MRHARLGWLLLLAWGTGAAAQAQTLPSGDDAVRFDLPSFLRVVQPMEHRLEGRLPILVWDLPMPDGRELMLLLEQDSPWLRQMIDELAARGIVPVVPVGRNGLRPEVAASLAEVLVQAGQPVHLLHREGLFIERWAWWDCDVWVWGPDASRQGAVRRWPCLPLARSQRGAERMRSMLEPFKQAGIQVQAVWADYESLPHPYNGVYEAQRSSQACRAHYPPGVLDDRQAFDRYTFELRMRLLSEMFADPVLALYPGALVGNYNETVSSEAVPFVDWNNAKRPPCGLGRLNVQMPAVYASNRYLRYFFGEGQTPTPEQADRVHLGVLLRTLSTSAANRPAGVRLVPFVSREVVMEQLPHTERAGMSRRLYRELIRHALLRGADGFYVFNPVGRGSPQRQQIMLEGFEMVEDVRAVYDQMLAFRPFLDAGEPMTLSWPEPGTAGVVWSGLRLEDECLVRAITLSEQAERVKLSPWPGMSVELEAPPEGATYRLSRDGSVTPLPME